MAIIDRDGEDFGAVLPESLIDEPLYHGLLFLLNGKAQIGAQGVNDLLSFPDKMVIDVQIAGNGKEGGESDAYQKYRQYGKQQNSCTEAVSVHGNLQLGKNAAGAAPGVFTV